MIPPFESVMEAVRFSHSTSSYGEIPALVKNRRKLRPEVFEGFGVVATGVAAVVWV
jgi:hypothetical protein